MGNRKKSRSLVVLTLLGIFTSAIAQGNPDRRWSVRKTGEFGRRLDSVSKELQLPSRQFRTQELNLELSETRRYDPYSYRMAGIQKPSLDLELPRYNSLSPDQEAQETGESDGYVYAPPGGQDNDLGGYGYDTPSPVAAPNPDEGPEPTSPPPASPSPAEPDVVAGPGGGFFMQFPLAKPESDEEIDADSLSARRQPPKPSFPQVSGVGSSPSDCTDDNDPKCWNHDYTDVIPGVAGKDYPVLAGIPETSFDCNEQDYSGYYADFDEVARCQLFHICLKSNKYRKTRKWDFICPNGTLFSQSDLVCVLWTEAPDCSDATVRSLYNINQELGWDNITEGSGSNKIGGPNTSGELQSAMSAFRAKAAVAKASNQKYDPNPVPPPRSGLPYRVPVKVNEQQGRPRTKLQEVTRNALHGTAHELDYGDNTEHDVEESSNFETSLRKQTESRHKTKTSSAIHASNSEAYELKGSADGVQPFIVNRPPPQGPSQESGSEQGGYENEQTEGPQQVVMMSGRQRRPDGSEGYAEVPVMLPQGAYSDDEFEGYRYPNPNAAASTPPPTYLPPSTTPQPSQTTTEDFPPPAIPTEPPLDRENYEAADYQNLEPPSNENADESGYNYPNPTTTERPEEDFNLPQRTKENLSDGGYQYPSPDNDNNNADQSEEGYRYPTPTTTENYEEDYRYTQATTEPPQDGYRYPNPTTAQPSFSSRYRETTTPAPAAPTEQTTTTTEEESDSGQGYQYPTPDERLGYNYPAPTTTDSPAQYPNEQYQVTDNEVASAGGYDIESTTRSELPQKSQDLVDSNEGPISTTTISPETETPAGGYLPPRSSDQLNAADNDNSDQDQDTKQLAIDEDTIGISGGGAGGEGDQTESDYEDEENEVGTGSTGLPEEEDSTGYSYNSPTPPSSDAPVLSGGALDSDEKVNEILKQIQNGGIEAVDSDGKPIEFDKLKELLLNSPRGSVELKGLENVDSVASPTTEASTVPQTEQSLSSQPLEDVPYYNTVTTAQVLPNNLNAFTTNQNQNRLPASVPRDSGPSFYLPPNANSNNAPQQSYFTTNNNNILVERPNYNIKLPNREFESHSVLTNSIDSNRNSQNQNQPGQFIPQTNQNQGYFPSQQQQLSPQLENLPFEIQQQPTPQQQFFPSQSVPSKPTLSTSLVIPNENYLAPSPPQQQQPDFNRPAFQNNFAIPTPQAQQQQEISSSAYRPEGEYLPPRQPTSSILQPQYYSSQASSNSPSQGPLVSQPIQLTENLQLQQSFAQTLSLGGRQANSGNSNPLINPKDIKIVPAVFVHQHTSIASQLQNALGGGGGESLDTSQSVYLPSESAAKYGAVSSSSSSLAQQLNQLANSAYLPQGGGSVGRQFTRRSNSNSSGGRSSSSSPASLSAEPSHTIEKATQVTSFTLEDARSPEELQKYHHEDLKRFHSENIAKKGGILDESYVPPPPASRPAPKVVPRVEHRFVTEQTTRVNNERESRRNENHNGNSRGRGSGSGSTSSSHHDSISPPTRFSVSTSNLSNSRGRTDHENFFIPVSGSYGGSSSSSSVSTSSRNSNRDDDYSGSRSQFRVSGRGDGGNGGGRGRSYVDSDSETLLLRRFLPEEEGGFGARLY